MDFARELENVESFLTGRGCRVAVIGGVALAAYGHPRMTLDLDVVTEAAAQESLVAMLEANGFRTLHRSAGFSNHRHPDRGRGRVDVMYVRGGTSDRLFAAARERPGPGGRPVMVPRPEHLIAMKVQAMRDAPERTWQDLVDIGFLARLEASTGTRCAATSCAPAWRSSGVSSVDRSERRALDLERDVPTTRADIETLRRLRRDCGG